MFFLYTQPWRNKNPINKSEKHIKHENRRAPTAWRGIARETVTCGKCIMYDAWPTYFEILKLHVVIEKNVAKELLRISKHFSKCQSFWRFLVLSTPDRNGQNSEVAKPPIRWRLPLSITMTGASRSLQQIQQREPQYYVSQPNVVNRRLQLDVHSVWHWFVRRWEKT